MRRANSALQPAAVDHSFHTIDTKSQWRTRFYHAYKPLAEIAATGANTVNIHHATAINPYINYPFLKPKEMKAYIDDGPCARYEGEDL